MVCNGIVAVTERYVTRPLCIQYAYYLISETETALTFGTANEDK